MSERNDAVVDAVVDAAPAAASSGRLTEILTVVGFAAERLLRMPDWEAQVPGVLAELGRAARASRCYLFTVKADASGVVRSSQAFEWVAAGVNAQIDNPDLQDLDLEAAGVGRWCGLLGAGEVVRGLVAALPLGEQAVLTAQDILAILVVPVFVDGRWWGFLGFDDCQRARSWTDAETGALRTAASLLGAAIERRRTDQAIRSSEARYQRLFAEARRQARELALLERVRAALASNAAMPEVCRTVVEGVHQVFGYSMVSLYLIEGAQLTLQHQRGYASPLKTIPIDQGVMAQVATSGRSRLIEDIAAAPEALLAAPGVSSEVAVPLVSADEVIGVLNVETTTDPRLGSADLRLLTAVADQLGMAFERESLHRRALDSEQRHRSAVESVREVIFQTDARGHWSFLNGAWRTLTGRAVEASLGGFFLDVVHPEDQALGLMVFTPVVRGLRDGVRQELRVLRPDGETRWAELTAQPRKDGERVLGASGTLRDVTERLQARRRLEAQKRFYETILGGLPASVVVFDREQRYLYCNAAAVEDEALRRWLIGKDDVAYCAYRGLDPELAARRRRHFTDAVASRGAVSWEERSSQDGQARHELHNLMPVVSAAGDIQLVIGYGFDISARKAAEASLEQQGKLLSSVLDNLPGIFYMFDETGGKQRWNSQLEHLTGYSGEHLQAPLDIIAEADRAKVASAVDEAFATGKATVEARVVTRSGDQIPHLLTGARLELGGVRYLLGTGVDISARSEHEAQLNALAYNDLLTKLPNRRALQSRAEKVLAEGHEVALLYLDLDRFKTINDTLGHDAGDALLIAIAARLESCLQANETLARLGGDEFAVLLNTPRQGRATALAERLLATLATPFSLHGQILHISASIGVASSQGEGTLTDLLKHADIAMYQAKAGGQGVRVFDPGSSPYQIERFGLEAELRRAVADETLLLHYQPVLDLRANQVCAFEALVRWPRANSLLEAATFVPLAEESDLIRLLDGYVLARAVRQAGQWLASGQELSVAVNLSARSLHDPTLAPRLGDALRAEGVPAETLLIEITESVAMARPEECLTTLQALRALGVRLAIDDFGSGFASLSYLRQLPVNQVKIDRYFVQGLGDKRGDALVRAAIALGHGLGLCVVAEGVEHPEQLEWLRAQGCDFAQGTLIGLAAPAVSQS